MSQKPTITLSKEAQALAEERAREEGFESIDAYVGTLIEEDGQAGIIRNWMRERLEQGLASPSAGDLTESKLQCLIGEGIARVSR